MDYNTRQKQLFVWLGVLAAVMVAFSFAYVTYLLNESENRLKNQTGSGVDIYEVLLNDKLGIHAPDYEERELYSDLLYEADKAIFIQNIFDERLDLVSGLALERLSNYRFEGDILQTLVALSSAEISWEADPESRASCLSSIADEEIYVSLLLLLPIEEQSEILGIAGNIPGFPFETISANKGVVATPLSSAYPIVGTNPYTVVTLAFKDVQVFLHMTTDGGIRIFLIEVL